MNQTFSYGCYGTIEEAYRVSESHPGNNKVLDESTWLYSKFTVIPDEDVVLYLGARDINDAGQIN